MSDKEQEHPFENNDDEFGIPEVSYDPIDRENLGTSPFETHHFPDEQADDNKKKIWLTISLLVLFLGIIGAIVYFVGFHDSKPPKTPVSNMVKEPAQPVKEPEVVEEVEPALAEPVPTNTYSEITTISTRTGRSYIIVGSFVDEDLARDFSNKLIAGGKGSVIIEPFGKTSLLHRVAIAHYSSFQEALANVDQYRSTFGPETWVLKY